jgi:hypothetical protein
MNVEDIKRLRFYEQQFLRAKDFQDEQAYHIEMRHRHLIAHHTWGVVVGLNFQWDEESQICAVQPGLAVDGFGREIVVFFPEPLDLSKIRSEAEAQLGPSLTVGTRDQLLNIWIVYYLEETALPAKGYEGCKQDEATRFREGFRLLYVNKPLYDSKTRDPKNPDTWPQPFDDLPGDQVIAPWPILLGTVTWECVSSTTNPTGKEVILQLVEYDKPVKGQPSRKEKKPIIDLAGRPYVGNITSEIIASAGKIMARDRNTQEIGAAQSDVAKIRIHDRDTKDITDATQPGVKVYVEGSLDVDRLLTANQSGYIKDSLGIGTPPVPSKSLDTASTIRIGNGQIVTHAENGALFLNAGPDTDGTKKAGIWFRTTTQRGEESSATDLMRVTEAGNVGIGNITPVAKLQVKGEVAFEKKVSDGNPLKDLPGDATLIWNDGTWLRINQNLDKKKIVKGVQISGVLAFDSLAIGDPDGSDDPGLGNVLIPGKVGIGTKDLGFPKIPDPFPNIQLYVQGKVVHSGGTGGGFSFGNRDTPSYIASPANGERWEWHATGGTARLWSNTDKLVVTSSGNIGIGTANPQAQLEIIPSSLQPWLKLGAGGDNGRLWVEYGSQLAPLLVLSDFDDPPRIRFQQIGAQTEASPQFESWIGLAKQLSNDLAIIGGKVGIGTTNPQAPLHLYSSDNPTVFRIQSSAGFGTGRLEFWSDPQGSSPEWRPSFIQSTDQGGFTGGLGFFVNGTGAASKTSSMEVMRITNGKVGIGTTNPQNTFHIQGNVSGNATLTDHVATIENISTTDNADVLALKVGIGTPAVGNNFITFFGGNNPVGRIEGNGAGGIVLNSLGADYAESLPRLQAAEVIEAGDIIGVFAGKVTKVTQNTQQVMVSTDNPVVLGNMPGSAERHLHEAVAFVGQVLVKVRGVVQAGDYIVPSGLNDGTGVAVSPSRLISADCTQIVGQAWESSQEEGVKRINTLVGISSGYPTHEVLAILQAQQAEIQVLRSELEGLKASLKPMMPNR